MKYIDALVFIISMLLVVIFGLFLLSGCGCETETVIVTKVEASEHFLQSKIFYNTGGFEYGSQRKVGERVRVCK